MKFQFSFIDKKQGSIKDFKYTFNYYKDGKSDLKTIDDMISAINFEVYTDVVPNFNSSVEESVLHIIKVLGGLRARRKIVKIGNGNMNIAKEIVNMLNLKFCSSFELEFVDEHKTSLKIKNFNQRGKRDMLSAKYISQREGFRYSILPLSLTG